MKMITEEFKKIKNLKKELEEREESLWLDFSKELANGNENATELAIDLGNQINGINSFLQERNPFGDFSFSFNKKGNMLITINHLYSTSFSTNSKKQCDCKIKSIKFVDENEGLYPREKNEEDFYSLILELENGNKIVNMTTLHNYKKEFVMPFFNILKLLIEGGKVTLRSDHSVECN